MDDHGWQWLTMVDHGWPYKPWMITMVDYI